MIVRRVLGIAMVIALVVAGFLRVTPAQYEQWHLVVDAGAGLWLGAAALLIFLPRLSNP